MNKNQILQILHNEAKGKVSEDELKQIADNDNLKGNSVTIHGVKYADKQSKTPSEDQEKNLGATEVLSSIDKTYVKYSVKDYS